VGVALAVDFTYFFLTRTANPIFIFFRHELISCNLFWEKFGEEKPILPFVKIIDDFEFGSDSFYRKKLTERSVGLTPFDRTPYDQ
jgi:hypothetical protein